MTTPTLSIITVCLNAERLIGETLQSVVAQTAEDFEHLIIDGASTDSTLQVVRDHLTPRTRVVSEPDSGIYAAMNKGAGLARGTYLLFLNAGDRFETADAAARVLEMARSGTSLLCWAIRFFGSHREIGRKGVWKPPASYPRFAAAGIVPAHPGTALHASEFRALGGLDDRFRIAADFDLFCRLAGRSPTITSVPEVLVGMRVGGASNGSLRGLLRGNTECVRAACASFGPAGLLTGLKPFYKLTQLQR